MPAKRRLAKKRANAITAEAVAAFRERDQATLHRALGLKPWEPSPLVLDCLNEECPWSPGTAAAAAWPKVRDLLRQLESFIDR
jgi:hypothetical protein